MRASFAALAISTSAGLAVGQTGTVEFRFVERTGQTIVGSASSGGDNVLDFAVQARVVGVSNRGVGDFSFNIRLPGEFEQWGSLNRLRIANSNGSTYIGPPTVNGSLGTFTGVAYPHRYLVGINSNNNGVINSSTSAFTNGPDQEIGQVMGRAQGSEWVNLQASGIIVPVQGGFVPATGSAYSTSMDTYFGANGNWFDAYRFRYTNSNNAQRMITFRLESVQAATFSELVRNGDYWGADTSLGAAPVSLTEYVAWVGIPNPGSALAVGICGLLLSCRRRRAPGPQRVI